MTLDDDLFQRMSIHPWFGSLSPTHRHAILSRCKVLRLAAGDYLCRMGDHARAFYGVESGRLRVSPMRPDGKESVVVVVETGQWFGQTSMLVGKARVHNIVAVEPVCLQVLASHDFEQLMRQASFARAIATLEAMHTYMLFQMLEDATLHTTRARIARRLIRLAHGDETMAMPSKGNIRISQDTLAMMLGITRQTLALELKLMVAEGAVSLRYGHIEILSMDVLRSFEACT